MGRDLRTLAGMVSDYRADLPAQGLPTFLLSELMTQIRCDAILFEGMDSAKQGVWFAQEIPAADDGTPAEGLKQAHWQHYWDCLPAAIPTGLAICARSSRSRTSTRPGSGTVPACTATCTGRRASSTSSC
jgi:hypothetical protein